MDYMSAFQISSMGMSVERLRLDVTSLNIANMNSTRAADGSLYQPLKVVVTAPVNFADLLQNASDEAIQEALEVNVEAVDAAPRKVLNPGHPMADANGFVDQPNVNQVVEMVNMLSASRSYEANLKAFNAAKTMALRALQIGGNN